MKHIPSQEIYQYLTQIPTYLSPTFLKEYQSIFHDDFLRLLSRNLSYYLENGVAEKRLPYFDEECTPSIEPAWLRFRGIFSKPEIEWSKELASTIQNTPIENLLLLAGQRLTSASLRDLSAIPPSQAVLLKSFQAPYKQSLTIGARAWTKHTQRSSEKFWGDIRGNDASKNQKALQIIQEILNHCTWWNVFEHYQHETVYEARLPSGHGGRWGQQGKVFIGFLEPFLETSS